MNENRAIVSEIAGTTRDTIEEVLNIDGVLFRLIDTAGIRTHTSDTIESIGVENSYEKMMVANLILYLFDVNEIDEAALQEVVNDFEQQQFNYLLVGNKVYIEQNAIRKFEKFSNTLFISAKGQQNITHLKTELVNKAIDGQINTEATIVTNARHFDALQKLFNAIEDVHEGLNKNIQSDLLALDIRQALYYLGEITGEITNEDQLDFIFSKFCIGK